MARGFDLKSYFARIAYEGPAKPVVSALRAIHRLHPDAIPFENMDPLLGRTVSLDVPALERKLVQGRRGGYCFEQNGLLAAALSAMGFSVTLLSSRVRWMAPPERPEGPRTHMLLRVDCDEGSYLADVGFGSHLFAAPLRLQADIEQPTPSNTMRIVEGDRGLTVQTHLPGGWQDVYRFTLAPEAPADFEVANWFTSTNPGSLFRNNLLAERLAPRARYSLFNSRLVTRTQDGTEERVVSGPVELAEVIDRVFGITLPATPDEIWARLPTEPGTSSR